MLTDSQISEAFKISTSLAKQIVTEAFERYAVLARQEAPQDVTLRECLESEIAQTIMAITINPQPKDRQDSNVIPI